MSHERGYFPCVCPGAPTTAQRLHMMLLRWSEERLVTLRVTCRIVAVVALAVLPTLGCSQKCGACLPRWVCYGEADAATCPSLNGACALVEKCMCSGFNCEGASLPACRASDAPSCNAMSGCAWVSVCNFVYPCSQFDSIGTCNAQSACIWDPSNGCS